MRINHKAPLMALVFLHGLILSAQAQLAFTADVKEFHPDLATQEIKTQFDFVNIGTAPVIIKEIKPSCGCTVAGSDKMVYKPGDKGTIDVTYSIHSSTGYQEKTIAVTTVENPSFVKILTIKAYVPALITYSPNQLKWNIGDAVEGKTVNINLTDKPVKLIGIEWTTDQVMAKLHTLKEGESYSVTVTPLSTDNPVAGLLMIKLLLPMEKTPRLAFIRFSIGSVGAQIIRASRYYLVSIK